MKLTRSDSLDQVDLSSFKSPQRMLVRCFLKSRDKWKAKCQQAKRDIKRSKNKAADAVKSRDRWKRKCEKLETDKQRLEAELAQLRAQASCAGEGKK